MGSGNPDRLQLYEEIKAELLNHHRQRQALLEEAEQHKRSMAACLRELNQQFSISERDLAILLGGGFSHVTIHNWIIGRLKPGGWRRDG